MYRSSFTVALIAVIVLSVAAPADAHHSWQLDQSKQLTLSGTVSRFDFTNPHVQIYFQAKDDAGAADAWQAGGPSPNQLARAGWARDSVKPGDQVTVVGYRHKDGAKILRFDTITLADGRILIGYKRGSRAR